MTNLYSEDALIERPNIALFGQLGRETTNCFDEIFNDDGSATTARSLFGRQQRKNAIAAP